MVKTDREPLKQTSREPLAKLRALLAKMELWTRNAQTQAEVETFILDNLYAALPRPPSAEEEMQRVAAQVCEYVWQRSSSGSPFAPAA
jgi:type I restriction enzyme, R subunit